MAYQTRSRDPLLDSNMQAAIEKRGKELIGICLILLGLATAAMVASYTPDDPNWIVSTDAPVQNWMGSVGASIAAPLFMIVGWGSWALALVLLVWGIRFTFHLGEERAFGRAIFAPIAIAFCSVYAATLVPGDEWRATHSFGLGGLFGDTVMGALLTLLPIGSHFAVKLMSVVMAVAMLTLGAFVLGFTKLELGRAVRYALYGVILTYGAIVSLLGRGASGGVKAAQGYRARRAERAEEARNMAETAAEAAILDDQMVEPELPPEPPVEKSGFLKRMPALIKRAEPVEEALPEPELVEHGAAPDVDFAPGDDRISAKIAVAVRSRQQPKMPEAPLEDRPLTKGRGRGPDPLVFQPQANALPPEPPVTAARSVLPPEPALFATQPQQADWQAFEADADALIELAGEPVEAALPLEQPVEATRIPVAEPRKAVVEQPARKTPAPSRQAQAEAQPRLAFEDRLADFELPPLSLLTNPVSIQRHHLSDEALEENARMLESVLDDYGVKGETSLAVRPGPVVTMYELEPAPGLKASRVVGLADDIARSMSALSARVSTVPGRSVIGIELPNDNREKVVLREILGSTRLSATAT